MDKTEIIRNIIESLEANDLAAADKIIDLAIELYPEESFGYRFKGNYYLKTNDPKSSIIFLIKAGQIENNFENQYLLGMAYLNLGNPDDAESIFSNLLSENESNPDIHYAMALLHTQKMDELSALQSLNELLAISPDHLPGLELRAQINQSLQNDEETLIDLTRILTINPSDIDARLNRIKVLKIINDKAAIETDYQYLIKNFEDYPDFRMHLGEYYLESGLLEDAVFCFTDVIDIQRRIKGNYLSAIEKRAEAYLRNTDYHKALDDYKLILKENKNNFYTYLGIAEACINLYNTDLAVSYLELGLDLVENNRWKLYQKLGEIYLDAKNWDRAEMAFKGMSKDGFGKAEAYFQLGLLYLKQGDPESAYWVLKEADNHLHEKAESLIEQFCLNYKFSEQASEELELINSYQEYIIENLNSKVLNVVYHKFWKLESSLTLKKNEILSKLQDEMRSGIAEFFNGLLFFMTANGLLIFNKGLEDNRALFKIISESTDTVIIETLPFGKNLAQDMSIRISENQMILLGYGTGNTFLDLYFQPISFEDLSMDYQTEFNEKKSKGKMEFLKLNN